MRNNLAHKEVRRVVRVENVLDLPAAAVRTRPATKCQPGHPLSNELAEFVSVFDASRNWIALVAAKHHQRRKTQGIGSLGKPEAIIQRVFGRENWNNAGAVCFGAKIDRDVPKIRFFATPDRTIRHEDKAA